MGLAQVPEDVAKMEPVAETVDEPGKRKLSPLERLKEKIRQKKLEKRQKLEAPAEPKETESETDVNGWEEMNDDLAEALGGKKKKLSKFDRRQRRLDELRAQPMQREEPSDDEPLFQETTTQIETPKYTPAELKALAALRRQKLRVRSDGTFNVRGAGGLGKATEKIVFRDEEEANE